MNASDSSTPTPNRWLYPDDSLGTLQSVKVADDQVDVNSAPLHEDPTFEMVTVKNRVEVPWTPIEAIDGVERSVGLKNHENEEEFEQEVEAEVQASFVQSHKLLLITLVLLALAVGLVWVM